MTMMDVKGLTQTIHVSLSTQLTGQVNTVVTMVDHN